MSSSTFGYYLQGGVKGGVCVCVCVCQDRNMEGSCAPGTDGVFSPVCLRVSSLSIFSHQPQKLSEGNLQPNGLRFDFMKIFRLLTL